MNKRNLRKVNKGLSAMGIEPLTEQEYADMIGAADACHNHPNQWNTYDRPWPTHHLAIGPIYMCVEERPNGINAIFTLLSINDKSVEGEISGCKSLDEAKQSLTYSIYKAATIDARYAAALADLVKAKVAAMGPVMPSEMMKSVSEILKPISGDAARYVLL